MKRFSTSSMVMVLQQKQRWSDSARCTNHRHQGGEFHSGHFEEFTPGPDSNVIRTCLVAHSDVA
ncbi:MAG: hypothetical protein U1F05_00100, partial [Burkholderiales bacterium]